MSSESELGEGDRIAKHLARAGVCSRRDAERLIAEGRVKVNGAVLSTPAFKPAPGDDIRVDGKKIAAIEPPRLWRYHKPAGLMTTHRDPQGRPTVFERLPTGLPRVVSVGRLDINSEGLLLLTNDGSLARRLELPSTGLVRRYRARAYGRVTQDQLDPLRDGLVHDGVQYGPIVATLERQQGGNAWIEVLLTEGKNREVRRVLEAIGLQVNRLLRLTYGPFELGELQPGQAEEVPPRQIRGLLKQDRPKPAHARKPAGAPAKSKSSPRGKPKD
jgi:23S rRNA pseudouridine2605 synthase